MTHVGCACFQNSFNRLILLGFWFLWWLNHNRLWRITPSSCLSFHEPTFSCGNMECHLNWEIWFHTFWGNSSSSSSKCMFTCETPLHTHFYQSIKEKIPQKVWILHKLGLKLQALSIFYRLLSPPVLQPHCANTLITKNFNGKPKNCISITRFGQRTSNRRSVWFLLPPVLLYSLLICLTEHPKWSCPLTWVGS